MCILVLGVIVLAGAVVLASGLVLCIIAIAGELPKNDKNSDA